MILFPCLCLCILLAQQCLVGLVALLGLLRIAREQGRLLLQHLQLTLHSLQLCLQLSILHLTFPQHSNHIIQLRNHRVRLVFRASSQLHLVHTVRKLQRLQ